VAHGGRLRDLAPHERVAPSMPGIFQLLPSLLVLHQILLISLCCRILRRTQQQPAVKGTIRTPPPSLKGKRRSHSAIHKPKSNLDPARYMPTSSNARHRHSCTHRQDQTPTQCQMALFRHHQLPTHMDVNNRCHANDSTQQCTFASLQILFHAFSDADHPAKPKRTSPQHGIKNAAACGL